jgi:nucleoid DNA-binding protein
MNEKINLQELIILLAQKANITKKEAEAFFKECFDTMNEALLTDHLIKVKGLGSFKLTQVNDRESIDVVTGERVLIPAHYKVNFTADNSLAQAINEPFALFAPVELNEDNTIVDSGEIILFTDEEEDAQEVQEENELIGNFGENNKAAFEPVLEDEENTEEMINFISEEENNTDPEENINPEETETEEDGDFIIVWEDNENEEDINLIEEDNNTGPAKIEIDDEIEINGEIEEVTDNFIIEWENKENENINFKDEKFIDNNKEIFSTQIGKSDENSRQTFNLTNRSPNIEHPPANAPIQPSSIPNPRTRSLPTDEMPRFYNPRKRRSSSFRWLVIPSYFFITLAVIFFFYRLYKNMGDVDVIAPPIISSPIVDNPDDELIANPQTQKEASAPNIGNDSLGNILRDKYGVTGLSDNNTTPNEKPVDNTPASTTQTTAPKPDTSKQVSSAGKEITVRNGQTLIRLAINEYGDKCFWIYIYEENKQIITNPNNVPVGTTLTIPIPEKYGIDKNDAESIRKAIEEANKIGFKW